MRPNPVYLALCRDCVAGTPDPDCWICAGQWCYLVPTAEKADLILRLNVQRGATMAITITTEETPGLRVWLARLASRDA